MIGIRSVVDNIVKLSEFVYLFSYSTISILSVIEDWFKGFIVSIDSDLVW